MSVERAGGRARGSRVWRWDALVLLIALLSLFPTIGLTSLFASSGGPAASSPVGAAGPTPEPDAIASGPVASLASPAPHESSPIGPSTNPVRTVTVASIPALLGALADDSVDVIVVADGTYLVSPSNEERPNSLWIGERFAARTRPVLVIAEHPGGVTFDGGGADGFGGLSFEDGAHDQTWDGFTFANMGADQSGIIEFGGYIPRRTPHHITMRNITVARTCTGSATSAGAPTVDHAVYISNAAGAGPHNLTFTDFSVDGRGGLASAFHFFHGDVANPNASDVTVQRLHVLGTQQAIILWADRLREIEFDTVDIRNALRYAIRYESTGSTGIVLSNITSTGSGSEGFFSSAGPNPPGVTFARDSLH